MPKPDERKTVQNRILKYAQEIGWTFVPRADAEQRRWFSPYSETTAERAAKASPYFDNLLYEKTRELNLKWEHFFLP